MLYSSLYCQSIHQARIDQLIFQRFSEIGSFYNTITITNPDIPKDKEKLFKWCIDHIKKVDSKLTPRVVLSGSYNKNVTILVDDLIDNAQIAIEVRVTSNGNAISFTVCSGSYELSADISKKLGNVKKIPKPDLPKSMIPMALWREDDFDGASYDVKEIYCPTFDEISQNYGSKVQDNINYLTKVENPDEKGKIILWHGPPGTGKTHCVRALARDWHHRLKATVEVILDPEQMFKKVKYMHSLLLSDYVPDVASDAVDAAPLRLIIIEDSAELFRKEDCRNTHGFARFLNLTDGLIGQGLRCVFLLTANEPIEEIDPAVIRAGRCLQLLEYNELSIEEVAKWSKVNEFDEVIDSPMILADLYAKKNKNMVTI